MEPVKYPSRCVERFLEYVTHDTQSREDSESYPSTPGQLVFLERLRAELVKLGLADVILDANGYLFATLPSTVDDDVPVIGFLAHVDTSPEMPGKDVRPIVHRNYQGEDIVLPDDPTVVLRERDTPWLAEQRGNDIITASGTTLLGADNKAGVAEIVAAAEYLLAHPEIPHGPIRIGFTPDEEIGQGTKYFDVKAFGASCAYTMDGETLGEIQSETFSADTCVLRFVGFNTHPGFAKGTMVNAIRAAARFIADLPTDSASPESTEEREAFVHPYVVDAAVDCTTVRVLVRSFDSAGLERLHTLLRKTAHRSLERSPGARVEIEVEESYRNMGEILKDHPQVVEHAREAIRRAGLELREKPIRGGTDGSRLSFMGLPTPNIFAGEHNFHSRTEWVSTHDMQKAVDVIIELCQVWAEAD
ncbi:MAG: peptidase T [Acidobacteriota bacterium]|nr:peptidase T [Acidobacteriota bacterium]MDH3784482.1 peptidase T [Acidobacteriota bacterium]